MVFQVQPDRKNHGDDTALDDVAMYCCEILNILPVHLDDLDVDVDEQDPVVQSSEEPQVEEQHTDTHDAKEASRDLAG